MKDEQLVNALKKAAVTADGYSSKLMLEAATRIRNGKTHMSIWKRVCDYMPPDHLRVIGWVVGSDLIRPYNGETLTQAIERTQREIQYPVLCYHCDEGWIDSEGYPMIVAPIAWTELEAFKYEE